MIRIPISFAVAGVAWLVASCAQVPARPAEAAPVATACPAGVASNVRCLSGRDSAGAHYLIAMPNPWNGVLVLHAHGGPALGAPDPKRSVEDLQRWQIVPRAGYAWAGSTFRQGGVAVRSAAEDTERLRRIFIDQVAVPKRTVLQGQPWGASVAAKGAETYVATWHFQDIVQNRTGRLNPFGNEHVRYTGSADDGALNAGVLRYRSDPRALARFGADTDLDGRIPVPVLTVHATDDPTAFVELDSAFRTTMERAGTAGHLVQTWTADHEHSYLSDPVYPALLDALMRWVEQGTKLTAVQIAERCDRSQAQFGPGCRFLPDYLSPPLAARVAPRNGS